MSRLPILLLPLWLMACGPNITTTPPGPPAQLSPPAGAPAVNARFADPGNTLPVDTVVKATCAESREFGKVQQGNWITVWYLVQCDVTAVEQGHWPGGRLVFVAQDAWPTPESGIMLDKGPWPYRVGATLRVFLNTRGENQIIKVEQP